MLIYIVVIEIYKPNLELWWQSIF